jgi:hypothetical protein
LALLSEFKEKGADPQAIIEMVGVVVEALYDIEVIQFEEAPNAVIH